MTGITDEYIDSIWVKMPFKILNKHSASDSIILDTGHTGHTGHTVLKIFIDSSSVSVQKKGELNKSHRNPTNKEQGLLYEKGIYEKKIPQILAEHKDAPLLASVPGWEVPRTPQEIIEKIVEKNTPADLVEKYAKRLALTMYILNEFILDLNTFRIFTTIRHDNFKVSHPEIKKPKIDYTQYWESKNYYKNFFNVISTYKIPATIETIEKIRTTWKLFTISTVSYVGNCYSLYDSKCGSFAMAQHLREVIRGLYILSLYGIVHNDIHTGNVLIVNDKESLIYDWDRAYIKGIDNRNLNSDICAGICGTKSQCNLFNVKLPTDFYKVLFYVVKPGNRPDWTGIFDMLNLKARVSFNWKNIQEAFIKSKNGFFSIDNCSYLQNPEIFPPFDTMTRMFGTTWGEVFARVFPGVIPPIGRLPEKQARELRALIKGKMEEVIMDVAPDSNPTFALGSSETIPIRQKIDKLPQDNIDIYKNINDPKMALEFINKLRKDNPKYYTWDNFVKLKDIVNSIKYGKVIPPENIVLEDTPTPKQDSAVIMANRQNQF